MGVGGRGGRVGQGGAGWGAVGGGRGGEGWGRGGTGWYRTAVMREPPACVHRREGGAETSVGG